jgi:subtilisin family serine protease
MYYLWLVVLAQSFGVCCALGAPRVSAQPPGRVRPPSGEAPCRPDEVLVCFDSTFTSRNARANLLRTVCNATLKQEFKLVPGLVSVKLPPGLTVSEASDRLKKVKGVRFVQPNYVYQLQSIPNDTYFAHQWSLNNTGQVAGATAGIDVRALKAWGRTMGSTNIIVAIIDTGIHYNHEDLVDNMWKNPGEIPGNGLDDDLNGYIDDVYGIDVVNNDTDPFDVDGHGTSCAGIIGAAGNNGKGIAGICWDVRLMGLKFIQGETGGTTEQAISCLNYAVNKGARIINCSWGTGAGTYDPGLSRTLEAAGAVGVLCIFPAGNEYGIDVDEHPVYPACYALTNIISVMSFDERGELASHSNFGATSVDLAAPGTNILTCSLSGNYLWEAGTSMAVPHVAGACALIYSLNPQLNWMQVRQIVLDTAERSETLAGLCVTGGRLNLSRAVARVIPETWLLEHGLLADGSAETSDADADGMINRDEWVAGTNPTNRASRLQFESREVPRTSNGFRVLWQSVAGKRYWLGSTEALAASPLFTPLVSNLLSTASTTEFLDERPAVPSRFYRVGVQEDE